MSDIKLLIEKKKTNEDKLISVFVNYCGKYIRKIYNSLPDEKIFLQNLIDISLWETEKKDKEYSKFLKWCKKILNVDEQELDNLLYTTLYLSIEIIVYNYDYSDFLDDMEFISTKDFFHKSMKSISRFYYENLEKINASDKSKNELTDIISLQIHKNMPLKKIVKFIQESEEKNPFVIKYKNKSTMSSETQNSLSDSREVSHSSRNSRHGKVNVEKIKDSTTEHSSSIRPPSSTKSATENSTRNPRKSSRHNSTQNSTRNSRKSSRKSSTRTSTQSSQRSIKSFPTDSNSSKNSSIENLQYIPMNNIKHAYKNKSKSKNLKEKYENVKHISLKPKKKF